jgi:hypothetical protein
LSSTPRAKAPTLRLRRTSSTATAFPADTRWAAVAALNAVDKAAWQRQTATDALGAPDKLSVVCQRIQNKVGRSSIVPASQPGTWPISVMRSPGCAPAFLPMERSSAVQHQRRRFTQSKSLQERLIEEAASCRAQARLLLPGVVRDALLRKARQAETAAHMNEWLSSPELPPPA